MWSIEAQTTVATHTGSKRMRTNKLSIYMIKQDITDLEDVVDSEEEPREVLGVGHFFFDRSHSRIPEWITNFFAERLGDNLGIFTASARGTLIVPIQRGAESVLFAVVFGVGRHLLKPGVMEERFGLKVVLNSVNPESFRSIEKTALGSVPKHSHEQMTRDVSPDEFGIDIEQDLIGTVTGRSRDPRLGKIITGKDALNLSAKVDATNVVEFLSYCYGLYRSDAYKTNFDWIDQIKDVRNPQLETELNAQLVQKLAQNNLEKAWMAVPEVINWSDLKGFRYGNRKNADLRDDVDLPDFLASLNGIPPTIEILKGQHVCMISAGTDDVALRWTAFRCLYAELFLNDQLYILNNAKWYAIAKSFSDQVVADYQAMPASLIQLPDCDGRDEETYNTAAAASLIGSCCMDQKFIYHGGGRSKIEFCDVYTSDKKMVHIKKYGQSAVLSHLFFQGVVSSELFAGDRDFRKKLNELLPGPSKLADPNVRPNISDFEVVYCIISGVDGPLDIPFFSKVSLRTARRRLANFGYKVSLNKIASVQANEG
jgi:uncharacterized protein (TIGR04141 family)